MNEALLNCGLQQSTINKLCSVFRGFEQIEKVVLYGSRAKGNYRNGSDIDLCLFGNSLNSNDLFRIDDQIDELLLPYTCDVAIWQNIANVDLRNHIERVGILFYQRNINDCEITIKEN